MNRRCECDAEKKHRITFDGGNVGQYTIDYCDKCYAQDDKQFMTSSEELK